LTREARKKHVNDEIGDNTGVDPDFILFRISRLEELLDLSRSRICQLIASGELASHKIGSARRVSASQLREFLARQSH
jgi:excisionase family DNA binding protein